jgi:tetratricopeptide (TPR) repeat protein
MRTTQKKRKKKKKASSDLSSADGTAPPSRRWRKWLTRLSAVVLAPLLFLAVVESGLWLFGYGYDTSYFIPAEKGDTYLSNPRFSEPFFGPKLARTPIQTVISPDKPDRTYRVFVFGGSAAQGVPDPTFSFPRILEAMLNDRYPQTRFEVINTGAVAVNSHVVLPVVRECGDFDGDLYIVYLGNNEVVGPYGAGSVFRNSGSSLSLIRAGIYVRSTRLGQLIGNAIRTIGSQDPAATKEWGGMGMFLKQRVSSDDPRMNTVYDNFTANLEDICQEARSAGVPIIVSTVLTNLKDSPPFHSDHRDALSTDDQNRWEELYRKAGALQESGDYESAAQQYAAAEVIDNRFAELHFRLGQCRLAQERFKIAREHFVRARDLDTLRFRADSQINRIIREVAANRKTEGVYLVDSEQIPPKIPGSELLHEHVHLNFAGNYLVASAIFEKATTLLPASIREQAEQGAPPPSLSRCEELTLYTDYNRLIGAVKIAEITMDPPFTEDHAQHSLAEAKLIEAMLTPEVFTEIARKYDRAVALRPDDLLLRQAWASLQSIRKEHASAVEQYVELIDRYPLCLKWHHQVGAALGRQGKTDEAIAKFRWVLQQDPNHVEARINLGSSLAALGHFDRAVEQYGKALSIRPKSFKAHFELGRILLRRGQPQQAEKHLAAAVEAAPSARRAHFFLGLALAKQGKIDLAIAQYRQECTKHPDNPLPHLELGRILLEQNKPAEAQRRFTTAAKIDAKAPRVQFLIGLAAAGQNDFDRAVQQFQRALDADPKDASAHFQLGRIHIHHNRHDQAQRHFASAIKIDPKKADYHYYMGRSLNAANRLHKAVACYRRAIELNSNHLPALNALAWLLATSPDPNFRDGPQAVTLARRASKLPNGNTPPFMDTLAAAYAEDGRFVQAAQIARSAIALARQAGKTELASKIETRLNLYLDKKPFRKPLP